MYALQFPDWKKIGRRVGKKLRDILDPPTHQGPSRDERRAQRLRDSLKGFVYLDDFDEVGAWSLDDVDSIQRANIPILERSASDVHDQNESTTSVMLCHDYNGPFLRSCSWNAKG